jgi:hypothetical protein
MPVGAVGALQFGRQIKRMPVNPLDKSTIVSIYPEEIHEVKPTIFPGYFHIPAAKMGDFETAIIGPSSWWKELDPDEPALEIPVSSVVIADSVIRDWAVGLEACNMGDKKPGLFAVPGAHDKKSIIGYKSSETGKSFGDLLADAMQFQKNWFAEIVNRTDVFWAASNGNPMVVSRYAKMAAIYLKMNRTWMETTKALAMSPCPACGNMINPSYPVCMHCKNIIDPVKAKELNLQFAR